MKMVRVNTCAPAHLIRGTTVNGNYFAWDVCGREVFISKSEAQAIEKMDRAIEDGVIF